uniref:ATP synthase complex subunit 8 n=1 Tax=Rubellomiris bispinosus TaxID=2127015 RepID=A0A514LQ53_9HEMI|nr:ATP synthase F0 subunit 8 [Rubellomiris bispinosus]
MPQMAPIWWFTLFSLFILTYYSLMMFMYFYKNYQLNKKTIQKNMNIKNIDWKW